MTPIPVFLDFVCLAEVGVVVELAVGVVVLAGGVTVGVVVHAGGVAVGAVESVGGVAAGVARIPGSVVVDGDWDQVAGFCPS